MTRVEGPVFRPYRSPTVGDNLAGGISRMTLDGGRIRGVAIDNPSASWILVTAPTGNLVTGWVPPYTLGWTSPVSPSQNELSAAYAIGPAGQPLQVSGSPITVTVGEDPLPASPGATFDPFASGSLGNQQLSAFKLSTATVLNGTTADTVIAAPGAGKRIRVTRWMTSLRRSGAGLGGDCEAVLSDPAEAGPFLAIVDYIANTAPVQGQSGLAWLHAPNTALNMTIFAWQAGLFVSCIVDYFIDNA